MIESSRVVHCYEFEVVDSPNIKVAHLNHREKIGALDAVAPVCIHDGWIPQGRLEKKGECVCEFTKEDRNEWLQAGTKNYIKALAWLLLYERATLEKAVCMCLHCVLCVFRVFCMCLYCVSLVFRVFCIVC